MRRDPTVAEAAGRELSKQLILANPDLVALRPLVDQAFAGTTIALARLVDVLAWLATHPDEVVTLFIEDHVAAADVAADVEQAEPPSRAPPTQARPTRRCCP